MYSLMHEMFILDGNKNRLIGEGNPCTNWLKPTQNSIVSFFIEYCLKRSISQTVQNIIAKSEQTYQSHVTAIG